MSSEVAMDDRVGGGDQPPPTSATTAGQVEGAAEQARRALASAGRSVRVLVSPVAGRPVPPPMEEQIEDDDGLKEMRAMWFNELRGWLMVVAVQVASVTYQVGLNPPSGLAEETKQAAGQNAGAPPVPESSKFADRYYMFFYFNTTAFVTSLAIIILLMNRTFYHSEARVVALEIIVVLDMVGLMGAYWAGSTRRDQTAKYTLVLTALVLFVVYVVYSVELLPKLWRLVAAAVPRRAPAARVRAGDAAAGGGGALPVPGQIDEARASSQRPQDESIARSISAARRRGSRPAGTEPSRMMSP